MFRINNPVSPAEDENIKALRSIITCQTQTQKSLTDDYIAIGKHMEKLRLMKSPTILLCVDSKRDGSNPVGAAVGWDHTTRAEDINAVVLANLSSGPGLF